MEHFDDKQKDLASFLCMWRRAQWKAIPLIPFLFGSAFCLDWPPRRCLALPPWGQAARRCTLNLQARLWNRSFRTFFLTTSILCTVGHPPPLGVTVFHWFFRVYTETPHLILNTHCFTLYFVPHVPYHPISSSISWLCVEPSIIW